MTSSLPNTIEHAQAEVMGLVEQRPEGTTCPSEVARVLAREAGVTEHWRQFMPVVHLAVDELNAQGKVRLSWKSVPMPSRSGPYRIGKANR